jgi:Thioredoxin
MTGVVSHERYASGMTFDPYLRYIATPENLARESSDGAPRRDYSDFLRQSFEHRRLTDEQTSALQWLVQQPGGPAKMLVISEEWSSDCRRDVPTFARIADVTGMELRIFLRDGQRFSSGHSPTLEEAPDSNADLMAEFLNHKNGQTYQSIPVCAFYSREMEYLYHYTEYPAMFDKDRLLARIRRPQPGESAEQTRTRTLPAFQELQASPFFAVWSCAAVDEIISALHRRLLLGSA